MRKFIVSIVLALFFATLSAPVAAAITMPAHACCFAHGEHHCTSAADPTGEPSLAASCPYHAVRALSSSVMAAAEPSTHAFSPATFAILASHHLRISAVASPHADGRAPPAFLS